MQDQGRPVRLRELLLWRFAGSSLLERDVDLLAPTERGKSNPSMLSMIYVYNQKNLSISIYPDSASELLPSCRAAHSSVLLRECQMEGMLTLVLTLDTQDTRRS